jgi:hypothetical protein
VARSCDHYEAAEGKLYEIEPEAHLFPASSESMEFTPGNALRIYGLYPVGEGMIYYSLLIVKK